MCNGDLPEERKGTLSERTERPTWATAHAVIWGTSALVTLGIQWALLKVVALAFETLAVNRVYQDFAPTGWMPLGRAAVLLGALPILVVGLARIGYRIAARIRPVADPVDELGLGGRFLLAAGLALPAVFFVPAFAAGLLVWLLAEAAWWVQWYQHEYPAMHQLMSAGMPYLTAATGILCAVGVWWAATARRSGDRRRSTLGVVALALVLALAAVGIAPMAGLGALHGSRAVPAGGRGLFEDRCGECHVRTRALFFVKTPDEWRRTVTRMREFEGADLDVDEQERVIGFLEGMRSFSDAWTYRTRCERCHLPGGLHAGQHPRDPSEWPGIVEGFERTSPYYYREDVRNQIVRHLERTASEPGATQGLDPADHTRFRAVGETCGVCHSVSRAADRYRDSPIDRVEDLVARMNTKMARPPGEADQLRVARDYRDLIAHPAALPLLYPHDLPVTEDPLLW